jgi:hypothetical protein
VTKPDVAYCNAVHDKHRCANIMPHPASLPHRCEHRQWFGSDYDWVAEYGVPGPCLPKESP